MLHIDLWQSCQLLISSAGCTCVIKREQIRRMTTSKQSGAYPHLSGWHWAEMHFVRPRFSGARIWSGVSLFQWQSVKVPHDRHRRDSGGLPLALNLLGGARSIAWRLRRPFLKECWRGPSHFGFAWRVWATALRPDPPKKSLLPHSSGWCNVRQILIRELTARRTNRKNAWALWNYTYMGTHDRYGQSRCHAVTELRERLANAQSGAVPLPWLKSRSAQMGPEYGATQLRRR